MGPYDLSLRHLVAHAIISRSGSLSRAAAQIHLTQPAVTQGLAKLERQFGIDLFVRKPGGVEVTEAGSLLAKRAAAVSRIIGPKLPTNPQIRAFLAVVRTGSYAAAAKANSLSAASLHRAVSDLGVTLGYELFERRGRTLLLTQRGLEAARRLSLAISEIESALVELATLSGRQIGRLRIGAMPLSRSRLVPAAVAIFNREYPDVGIAIVEGSFTELVRPLRDGEISVMLGALRADPGPDLCNTALFRDRPVIVGRKAHPLEGKRILTAAVLADYPWIVSADGTPLRRLWNEMFEGSCNGVPPVAIECGSVITLRHLLAESDYLTLLSPDQVAVEVAAGLLATLGTAPGALDREIGSTVRRDWRPTPHEKRFLAILEELSLGMPEPIVRIN